MSFNVVPRAWRDEIVPGGLTWIERAIERNPYLSLFLAYFFVLLAIRAFVRVVLYPSVRCNNAANKGQLHGGSRHSALRLCGTQREQGEEVVYCFPSTSPCLPMSAVLFSSRLFLRLLWTCSSARPFPLPRRQGAVIHTAFITAHYRAISPENPNRTVFPLCWPVTPSADKLDIDTRSRDHLVQSSWRVGSPVWGRLDPFDAKAPAQLRCRRAAIWELASDSSFTEASSSTTYVSSSTKGDVRAEVKARKVRLAMDDSPSGSSRSAPRVDGKRKRYSWMSVRSYLSKDSTKKQQRLTSWLGERKKASVSSNDSTLVDIETQLREEVANCTSCQMVITPAMLEADLANGTYDPNRTPAYDPPTSSVWEVDRSPTAAGLPQSRSCEERMHVQQQAAPTSASQLAMYAFHRHLHEHRYARRSFMTMCRDFVELREWQVWATKAELKPGLSDDNGPHNDDGERAEQPRRVNVFFEIPGRHGFSDGYIDIDESNKKGKTPVCNSSPSLTGGFASDLKNQVRLWWNRAEHRRARVQDSERQWEKIKKEREYERRQALRRQRRSITNSGRRPKGIMKIVVGMREKRKRIQKQEEMEIRKEQKRKKQEQKTERTSKTRPPPVDLKDDSD